MQPELNEPVVEYVLRPAARASPPTAEPPSAAVLFLVDDTAGAAALGDVLEAVRGALPLLPPDALIGLLAFGTPIKLVNVAGMVLLVAGMCCMGQ